MTLNAAKRAKVSAELIANFELSGVSAEEAQTALGLSADQLNETLLVGPLSQRDDVMRLRDYLDRKLIEIGEDPLPYSLF